MKWLLFAISLFALWVAFNSLYMLPGAYSAFNFELAGIAIAVGVFTAWLSSKRFADAEQKRRCGGTVTKAPPMVLCIFILVIFCVMAVLKLIS